MFTSVMFFIFVQLTHLLLVRQLQVGVLILSSSFELLICCSKLRFVFDVEGDVKWDTI